MKVKLHWILDTNGNKLLLFCGKNYIGNIKQAGFHNYYRWSFIPVSGPPQEVNRPGTGTSFIREVAEQELETFAQNWFSELEIEND